MRQLAVAHFDGPKAATRFETEFEGYLMPGVLSGSELAEVVAEVKGMPGEWVEMEGRDMDALTSGEKTTVVRQPADWHPYNPNAEQEARIAAEGLYTDPLHQLTTFDEDDLKVEPAAPDFDL